MGQILDNKMKLQIQFTDWLYWESGITMECYIKMSKKECINLKSKFMHSLKKKGLR